MPVTPYENSINNKFETIDLTTAGGLLAFLIFVAGLIAYIKSKQQNARPAPALLTDDGPNDNQVNGPGIIEHNVDDRYISLIRSTYVHKIQCREITSDWPTWLETQDNRFQTRLNLFYQHVDGARVENHLDDTDTPLYNLGILADTVDKISDTPPIFLFRGALSVSKLFFDNINVFILSPKAVALLPELSPFPPNPELTDLQVVINHLSNTPFLGHKFVLPRQLQDIDALETWYNSEKRDYLGEMQEKIEILYATTEDKGDEKCIATRKLLDALSSELTHSETLNFYDTHSSLRSMVRGKRLAEFVEMVKSYEALVQQAHELLVLIATTMNLRFQDVCYFDESTKKLQEDIKTSEQQLNSEFTAILAELGKVEDYLRTTLISQPSAGQSTSDPTQNEEKTRVIEARIEARQAERAAAILERKVAWEQRREQNKKARAAWLKKQAEWRENLSDASTSAEKSTAIPARARPHSKQSHISLPEPLAAFPKLQARLTDYHANRNMSGLILTLILYYDKANRKIERNFLVHHYDQLLAPEQIGRLVEAAHLLIQGHDNDSHSILAQYIQNYANKDERHLEDSINLRDAKLNELQYMLAQGEPVSEDVWLCLFIIGECTQQINQHKQKPPTPSVIENRFDAFFNYAKCFRDQVAHPVEDFDINAQFPIETINGELKHCSKPLPDNSGASTTVRQRRTS